MIGTFAHEETSLTIEGAPVPFARLLPDHGHLAVRVSAQEPTPGEIDKGDRPSGMPQRPFCAPPTRGEQGRLRGVQDVGPVLRHSVPPSCHACGVARLRVGARRPGWRREALSMPGAPRLCASLVLLPGACAFAERSRTRRVSEANGGAPVTRV
jgi:hypothetical protein